MHDLPNDGQARLRDDRWKDVFDEQLPTNPIATAAKFLAPGGAKTPLFSVPLGANSFRFADKLLHAGSTSWLPHFSCSRLSGVPSRRRPVPGTVEVFVRAIGALGKRDCLAGALPQASGPRCLDGGRT